MEKDKGVSREHTLITIISQLLYLIAGMTLVIAVLIVLLLHDRPAGKPRLAGKPIVPDQYGNFTEEAKKAVLTKDTVDYWQAPDIDHLDNTDKEQILYGKELIVHTSNYYGANGSILRFGTNGMNCQNCHLDAGTKIFGNNYSAVASTYPKYRARSGTIENIYKRVNDCFERSLNGKAIDTASKEMQAIVAYFKWLGKDVAKGKKPEGVGLKELALLDRPADAVKGKDFYTQKCMSCHQPNGEGLMNEEKTIYLYPPLWGTHSYNDGAGLYRLSSFAKFIKCNMPQGANYKSTQLTDEEAWDIAAFVNSQPRPKKNIQNDWPNIEEKPFDQPYGPYADGFDEKQHKYGPFKPIQEKLANLKKNKKV